VKLYLFGDTILKSAWVEKESIESTQGQVVEIVVVVVVEEWQGQRESFRRRLLGIKRNILSEFVRGVKQSDTCYLRGEAYVVFLFEQMSDQFGENGYCDALSHC